MPEKKGLALEAAFTAEAWMADPKGVRGGLYCLSRLGGGFTGELRAVAEATGEADTMESKAKAVKAVARRLGAGSALWKHLRNQLCPDPTRPLHC